MPRNMEAYLDIETTGLSAEYSEITVVGIYITNGFTEKLVQLVGHKVNADSILDAMDGVDSLYTYNGRRFDLPFINTRCGVNLDRMYNHTDLMFNCWKNNLKGGLKKVEVCLGIARETKGVDGLEAVRLWWRYVNDYDEDALATLLAYNREDVVNLKALKNKLIDLSKGHY